MQVSARIRGTLKGVSTCSKVGKEDTVTIVTKVVLEVSGYPPELAKLSPHTGEDFFVHFGSSQASFEALEEISKLGVKVEVKDTEADKDIAAWEKTKIVQGEGTVAP